MPYIYSIFFKEDCQGLVSVKTQKTYKPLLFTSFTATYAQKPQNSGFARHAGAKTHSFRVLCAVL